MREKRLKYNTISSLLFQLSAVICGFILPRLILEHYGSEVNGLINSITQFLGIINFMELGVGAVVQSSLYEPLANHDNNGISRVFKSASKFYFKIATISIVYVVILLLIYPRFGSDSFERVFTMMLISAMYISSFAQNYLGIVDRLLLSADQRGYIQYSAQTISIITNTILSAVLIKCGASVISVKLIAAIVFLAQPVFLKIYVRHNYRIDKSIAIDVEPIKQKWNGLSQHIAAVVLDSTDTIILTLFSSLSNVSIYSVYHLVVYGVKNLFTVMTNGIQSYWGDMWAKAENKELYSSFEYYEWLIHMGVVFIFGCTSVLIIPFVQVYTQGITDANYIVPLFAALITLAHGAHCLRLPYHILIKAVGHYRETQRCYIIAVFLNLIISVVTVKLFGLVGVAIGTLVAMVYQTVWMAHYDYKEILKRNIISFYKLLATDLALALLCYIVSRLFVLSDISYISWFLLAIKVFFVWMFVVLVVNWIVFHAHIKRLLKSIHVIRR